MVKERFSASVRSKAFRFLRLLRSGAIVPRTITTTANATKNQKDALLAGAVGGVATAAGVLAVSAGVLAVAAGAAGALASAAGVLAGSGDVLAVSAGVVAAAAGAAGCFR